MATALNDGDYDYIVIKPGPAHAALPPVEAPVDHRRLIDELEETDDDLRVQARRRAGPGALCDLERTRAIGQDRSARARSSPPQ